MKIDSTGIISQQSQRLTSSNTIDSPNSQTLQSTKLTSSATSTDKISLSEPALEFSVIEPDTKVYQGREHVILMEESAKTDQMDAVLKRLNLDQQQVLIDSNFLADDDFLALAAELSDSQLKDLASVVEGMQTAPKLNNFPVIDLYGYVAAKSFITTLSAMDESSRGRVLEQASVHAAKVPSNNNPDTYQPHGLNVFSPGSAAANDLHNFVSAINKHQDVNTMLDKLAGFSDLQQSDLLHILGNSSDLGDKLMDQLVTRDTATQDSMLSMLSQLSQDVSAYTPDVKHIEGAYAILGHDNNSGSVVWGMIEDSIDLMGNYQFSDDQLKDMSDSLLALDRGQQRAYLEITKTGLAHLLGTGDKQPVDLEKHTQELATIDDLRSSFTVLETVFKSRMGDKRLVDDAFHYELKGAGVGERDQKQLIEVLVTDAWLKQTEESSTSRSQSYHYQSSQLAHSLNQLEPEQRDEVVEKLAHLSRGETPLAERDIKDLHDSHESFKTQAGAIANSDDVSALLEAEADTPPELQPAFWQATKLAGKEVDKLVELLQTSDRDSRMQVIQDLAKVSELVDKGETSAKEADKFFDDYLELNEQPTQ